MEIIKSTHLDDYIKNNQPFNLKRFKATFYEKIEDYKLSAKFYQQCGDFEKVQEMNLKLSEKKDYNPKLIIIQDIDVKEEAIKIQKNKILSNRFLERILKK